MLGESIVYGCIKDGAYDNVAERRRTNREAMLSLPSAESWPILAREMFSVPQQTASDITFHTEVMHFGASYQGIEYEWQQWLDQFESLLRKMYWVSASVHLETEDNGTHSFVWETDGEYHVPGSDAINIRCEWTRESWLSTG